MKRTARAPTKVALPDLMKLLSKWAPAIQAGLQRPGARPVRQLSTKDVMHLQRAQVAEEVWNSWTATASPNFRRASTTSIYGVHSQAVQRLTDAINAYSQIPSRQ